MALPSVNVNLSFETEREKIGNFLEKHVHRVEDPDLGVQMRNKYVDLIKEISERTLTHLEIDLEDVAKFDDDDTLVSNIESNTIRYTNLFYQVADGLMPANANAPGDDCDPVELMLYQRSQRDANAEEEDRPVNPFPPSLVRRYTLSFKPRSSAKALSVREIKGSSIGKMIKVRGMVTRVSNVKPKVVVAAYSCDQCGNEIFTEVVNESWTPMTVCPGESCKKNNTKGVLHMQTRASKFLKFQEIRLQELTDQVPVGHIPRSMSVHLIESHTRAVNPGETVIISGVIVPVPHAGFKAIRSGLLTETYLLTHHVDQIKKQYSNMEITPEIYTEIEKLVQHRDLYNRLAKSIAPEIYGHEDLKKALLLLLVGGATKETGDGMKIRGDINICLMGDPGVAKSQLLKYISKIAPRAVYTTGRGSSGVGLTASVARDPVTEEMVLEGGALVLADNGIACIDEFDKMDESDRTAIHEVMEQQTISISKAGITTTLNARTSILAAANPQYGRYNPRLKATDNINLPAALLSRFDLLFLLLDKPSIEDDLRLAQHVTYVHQMLRQPQLENQAAPVDISVLRHYIALARNYNPVIPSEVGDYVVNAYVHMREVADDTADFQYTCARTLLSVIRLASALARLRFSDEVGIFDVDEALRLIDVSKASLSERDSTRPKDVTSAIFELIKEMCTQANGKMISEIPISNILERVINKGYSEENLRQCISVYEEDDVWMTAGVNNSTLRWIRLDDDDEEDL